MRRPCLVLIAATAATALAPDPAAAQVGRTDVPRAPASASVPRFAVAPSPIQLTADARPARYLGVTGPRSAWLGTETGPAELWVHPLKVVTDFQLSFKVPQYREPVRGVDVATTIDVRPEMTTITYTHMAFTVKQHILTPRDEAGILVLLDVQSFQPLSVVVRFRPVLQSMWPGSFGGQYSFWDAEHQAFVLSESLQRRNAVIGTSWPATGEAHPTHALPDAPAVFDVPVDPARAAREFLPIAIAAGTAPRDSVFVIYHRLLAHAEELYHQSRAWADSARAATTGVDTPDDSLDLALEWAKVNLQEQRVCNPDLGCGLVAGWGRSGRSTRPGFGWFFGGDAAINSLAMDVVGQWGLVAEGLRFLAGHQRDDGKIPHEVSQSAARIPWFTDYPYAYYHADTTPYWMVALWKYWQASGDEAALRAMWPAYRKAWAWCLTAETDGDGLIENTVGGYGAIEVGALGENLHEDIYLGGVWVAALDGTVELARHLGEDELVDRADELRASAMQTLNERYWLSAEDRHAFGILRGGGINDSLTAWPGTALSFGLLQRERAERTLRKLATDAISSDWGARLLSVGSDLYDPLHYNNGAVWPFMSGFVAWGQYAYRRPWSGYHLIDAVKQATFHWSLGRHPENLSGAYYRPMDATVPQQFFSSSMLVTPLLRGVLGWDPDAPTHQAALAPQLPPRWDRVRVTNLRVGATRLDVEMVQTPGSMGVAVTPHGPPLDLKVVLPVPLGAVNVLAGRRAAEVRWGPHDGRVARTLHVQDGGRYTCSVSWRGGLRVAPPTVDLVPGQASSGVRVVDFVGDGDGWRLDLEGEAGRDYDVRLYGEDVAVAEAEGAEATMAGPRDISADAVAEVLHVRFPDGNRRRRASVHLRPAG